MASTISVTQYRVYCTEGDGYVTKWGASEPTVCPLNAAHAIDTNQTTILQVVGQQELKTNDDNRLVVAPSLMPDTYTGQFMGVSDDFDNGSRGDGPRLFVSMPDGSPVSQVTIARSVDVTLALGCDIASMGGNSDDYINVTVMAPATPVVANAGGTGNCNLVPVAPGVNLIVPNPTSTGTHDVNLTEPVNANLTGPNPPFVSKAVPVPAEDISGNITAYNGFWEYNDGTGAISPSYTQTGRYNLFDAELPLTRFIKRWSVWTDSNMYRHEFFIHNKGARVMPHWYLALETTRAASHAPTDPPVEYQFRFYVARKRTV